MKGTLFSADFIKDSSNNLRLLELNTDTGFISSSLSYFNFDPLKSVINANSISEFHVIYKSYANNFVTALSSSLQSGLSGSLSFNAVIEDINEIYPVSIADASNKFILRLAYDEAAILDSTYCADNIELYKLFVDNSNTGSISEFKYHSATFNHDNLPEAFNSNNLPDFAVKGASSEYGEPITFHKVGIGTEVGVNDAARFAAYKATYSSGSMVQPFYHNSSDAAVKAIRNYSIIYGSDLDLMTIGEFEADALFDKPDAIYFDYTATVNSVDVKHYYELTTNAIKTKEGGIVQEEEVVLADGSFVGIESASVGDSFKSYLVSGSPDSDDVNVIKAWSYPGSTLPSGSAETVTTLVNRRMFDLDYKSANRVTLDGGSSFAINGSIMCLVYDIDNDVLRYENIHSVDPAKFKFVKSSGETVDITSNNVEIYNDHNMKSYILDMEETDTYYLKGGDVAIKLITHNCVVEGSLVTNGEGELVPIESIKSGDLVQSAKINDDGSFTLEAKPVTEVISLKKSLTYKIHVGGKTLEGTGEHPAYVNGDKVRFSDLKVGDKLTNSKGEEVEITDIEILEEEKTVYNLTGVVDNRNFFVEDYLLWNKGPPPACFTFETKIEMYDGSFKAIGEVKVGDEVKTMTGEKGIVKDALTHPINDVVPVYKNGNVGAEANHPILLDGEWTTPAEANWNKEWKMIDNFYNLEVEGGEHTYIVEGIVASGLGDNKELNNKYKRQPENLIKHL